MPKSKILKPLRIGEIVYLKNVGFPFNRTDDGHESWEGVSGVVAPSPAQPGSPAAQSKMVYVRAFRPIKTGHGRETMDACHFHYPEQVRRENRPWLRRNLKAVFAAQAELRKLRDKLMTLLPIDA